MTAPEQVIEKYFRQAVDEFDTNPLAMKLLRRIANEGPDQFFRIALRYLNSQDRSNAHRYLSILLLRQDELLDHLVSPALNTRESSVRLFNRFLEVDPSFDVRLARKLPGRSYWNHAFALDSVRSSRALDILDQTSRGRRLLPILGHLPESEDPKISSKATLFVGRRVQNPAWTRRQLERGDQRVRANAVEALWGVNTPPAISLLERCMDDKNNRVIGNALVGLHIVGREDAQSEALLLSRDAKADLRTTAAWVLGQMGSRGVNQRLTELVRDEHPQVRGAALRALMELRRTEVRSAASIACNAAANGTEATAEAAQLLSEELVPHNFGNLPELRLDGSTYSIPLRR